MGRICFCVGDIRSELGNLIQDIKMISRAGHTPVVILDPGIPEPTYLEAMCYTDLEKDVPIRDNWNAAVLVAGHRSKIGQHLVEHWTQPQIKFLYQGLYAPTKEWLDLHSHLHTVWGLMEVCVKGFEKLNPYVVNASETREMSPGPRLLELLG